MSRLSSADSSDSSDCLSELPLGEGDPVLGGGDSDLSLVGVNLVSTSDRSFLTEVLLPRQHLRRDPTPMQLPRLHLPVVRMWMLLPQQHPTIQVARSRLSHWLQRPLRDPTPMQLPRLHLPVDVDAAATTASDNPGRPIASVLLAPASSVRPDSDAATTTAPDNPGRPLEVGLLALASSV